MNRDARLRNQLGFFPLFFLMIVATTLFNRYFVDRTLAFNLLLPIYLTAFVETQNMAHGNHMNVVRNLVFFTLICAFI